MTSTMNKNTLISSDSSSKRNLLPVEERSHLLQVERNLSIAVPTVVSGNVLGRVNDTVFESVRQ